MEIVENTHLFTILNISLYIMIQVCVNVFMLMSEFLKTVWSIGFSDKKLFGPTGRRS